VLDVGEQQFLMLLFVLQAELDQRVDRWVVRRGEQRRHALVDLRTIGLDLGQAGTRDEAALRPRMLLAHLVVVAVEQHPVVGVERLEAALVALEHEGFEKPRHVRQMPLGRADVGHRLHLRVGLGQRLGQEQRLRAHLRIAAGQRAGLDLRTGQRMVHGASSRMTPCAM
jgi:hypothetical protein